MRVLQSRLLEVRRREEEATKKQLAGDVKASWGEQMRSYVLAPYQMVKDLRTEHEENNPANVFDGGLDKFIAAGIHWRAQSQA
jgi:peptide chain release factor 2